jgi:HAE1 family hydrophobic/amphiphilic exporter-1
MKLAEVSIRRSVSAAVLNLVLIVLGAVAYPRIGVDLFPEVDFPVATVTAVYPGADPGVVETKVVDKLEEAINTIGGIETMRSVSLENVGQVIVQFGLERDIDEAAQDVRDKVSAVSSQLPADLDPPIVEKFDVGAAPILTLVVSAEQPLRDVTKIADDVVKAALQKIDGVGKVDLVGGREREIHVNLRRDMLAWHGLTPTDVARAIQAQNLEVPGGNINTGLSQLSVKTKGEVDSAEKIGELTIASVHGVAIPVKAVAEVIDAEEEAQSASNLDGKTSVLLVIQKQSGANTVEVAHGVKDELEKLGSRLPAGYSIDIAVDNSVFIEASINDVQFDLVFGAVLTVLIILLFLRDWRATLIAALALPTSVVATFAFIDAMDFTFNNMTMLALTLSVGILIDDAIVVIENIHRHLEMGKTPRQAAQEATSEIGLAVLAITASIMAVFIPVAVMDGIVGRFFFQFGMTVSFAVAVSLLVSFTLTPMLSSRFLRSTHGARSLPSRMIEAALTGLERGYTALIRGALRFRLVTIVAAIAIFAGSIQLLGFVDKEFLPPEDRGEFKVVFELPAGSSLEASEAYAEQLGATLRQTPGVTMLLSSIGGGAQGQVNKGEVHVELVAKAGRAFDTMDAIQYVRKAIGDPSPAIVSVEPIAAISGGGFRNQAIQFNVRGQDFDEINRAVTAIQDEMRQAGGYVDIDATYRGGKPELRLDIDRDRAAALDVPAAALASTVRMLVAGEKISEVPIDGERVDVRLRLHSEERGSSADLAKIKVRNATGSLVDLANVVTISDGLGPAQIERESRQRQVTILANLEGKPLGAAVAEVDAFAKKHVPQSLSTSWTGQADTMQESMVAMVVALILAIVLVYLILAAQFESFIDPIVIMLSLPLATVGAFGALWLADMSLNIFSMIGLIMLIGLVVKNAVLLVDYTNVLRDTGLAVKDALVEAGRVRLRPILMTTAAMVFGMIPVATAQSMGGEQRAPMAVAVIGGLITSTVLTLVVIPVVYSLFSRARRAPDKAAEAVQLPHSPEHGMAQPAA